MLRIDVGGQAIPPWTGDPGLTPDGIYHADTVEWSPAEPSRLVVDVRRYDPCGLLSANSCEQPPDGQTFLEGQLGIAADPPRRITIVLDESVRVGLMGWDADLVTKQASGTDLASLLIEFDRAYNEVLAAPLLAGGDPDQIIAGLQKTPAEGFGPDDRGALRYTYDGAHPLLLQGPFIYTDGGEQVPTDVTSIVRLNAIQFDHGVVSLYFFAAYYP